MRIVLVAAALVVALPATAPAAELTPDGPATLMSEWTGAITAIGTTWPGVLVAARVNVAEGGRAGIVRIRARHGDVEQSGDPIDLPAEPGTYALPAPHIRWYLHGQIGIEQTTGGHALIQRQPCAPELGDIGDPCQIMRVNLSPPHAALLGARLTIKEIVERDADEDFLGDETEDRTDLRLELDPRDGADGRTRVVVIVTNVGPLTAHLPSLTVDRPADPQFEEGCLPASRRPIAWLADCLLEPIAPGASRAVTLLAEEGLVRASAEGPDLAPDDNVASFSTALPSVPALTVRAAKKQSLRKGVKVTLRGGPAGRARVTLALGKLRVARTVTLRETGARTMTIRPTGAKLRSLRRHLPGKATITVRPPGGGKATTVKTTLRR